MGPPEVRADRELLVIPRRRIRALLFYLAASLHPQPRARLAALFWGDLPQRDAERNLTDALYRLRLALGKSGAVVAGGEHVSLNREADCWIDVADIEARLPEARQARSEAAAAALWTACEQWRGSFLDGFDLSDCPEFNEWLGQERQRVEALYVDSLALLCEVTPGWVPTNGYSTRPPGCCGLTRCARRGTAG